jgi:hypothetical protein
MPTRLTPAERRFWLRWVLATALGSFLGGAVSGAVVLSGELRFAPVSSSFRSASVMALTEAVAFAAQGATVGMAQGLVLRHSLARSGWWGGATTGGWAAAGTLSGVLAGAFGGGLTHVGPDAGPLGVVVTAAGSIAAFLLLPGLWQWLVLRRLVERAGRWVLVSAGSCLAGTAIAFPVMVVVARAMGWPLPSAQAWGLSGALTGWIGGAITGAMLVQLLRQLVPSTLSEQGAPHTVSPQR